MHKLTKALAFMKSQAVDETTDFFGNAQQYHHRPEMIRYVVESALWELVGVRELHGQIDVLVELSTTRVSRDSN